MYPKARSTEYEKPVKILNFNDSIRPRDRLTDRLHLSAKMAAALQALFPKLGLSKKALLLGAGFVTKPTSTVQILSDAGVDVTVGILQILDPH